MAHVTLTVQGELREISLDSFLLILRESLSILQGLDRAISQRRNGTLKWVLSGLQAGSAIVVAESRVVRGDEDFGPQVARHFVDGIYTIQTEGVTPALFSMNSMNSMRNIVRSLGTNGVSVLDIATPGLDKTVELSSEAEDKVEALVEVHHKSVGSVEGRVELISVHRGTRRFNVYHAITQKAVRCNLPEEMEDEVVYNLRQRRRVIVSGLISYNVRGEPLSIAVDHLRVLKEEKELPTIEDILGIAPDITGDLSTEDYIKGLRNG